MFGMAQYGSAEQGTEAQGELADCAMILHAGHSGEAGKNVAFYPLFVKVDLTAIYKYENAKQ
jgi:hypothetical protein